MDLDYIDFARKASKGLAEQEFVKNIIIQLSNLIYKQDVALMRSTYMCHMCPMMRVFDGDLLIKHKVIPAVNTSEAFNYIISLGVNPEDGALFREADGKINFTLKLSGLKKIAAHQQKMKIILEHVQWVLTASEIYKSK